MTIGKPASRMVQSLQTVGVFIEAVSVVRVPLIVALLAAVSLILPDETREIYRVLATNPEQNRVPIGLAFSLLLVVSLVSWYTARNRTIVCKKDKFSKATLFDFLLRWLPWLCGAAIPLGAAIGLFATAIETNDVTRDLATTTDVDVRNFLDDINDHRQNLFTPAFACFALAVFLLPVAFIAAPGRWSKDWQSKPWLAKGWQVATGFLAIAIILGAFVTWPVVLPQRLGSLAIAFIFIIALLFFLELSVQCCDRFRVPLISVFIILWVAFGLLNINDSHVVAFHNQKANLASQTDAFKAWYRGRADKDYYEARHQPYPVFIVTAEGGGLYAAHHAAIYLSRLQDQCANFAQHIFAISAVSGGSLGGALFASLAKQFAQNSPQQGCTNTRDKKGEFERRAHEFLNYDFMAPIVASALFPEFLQSVLPFPIERFDRAKAFEASIEHAWTRIVSDGAKNPFGELFLSQWSHDGAAPALVLNSTDAFYGYRMLIAPFRPALPTLQRWLNGMDTGALKKFDEEGTSNWDLKLSTAIGISSRFPWVLPAATIEDPAATILSRLSCFTFLRPLVTCKVARTRLVDGGYFDNSGGDTALDMILFLKQFEMDPATPNRAEGPFVKIQLIAINGTQDTYPSIYNLGLGEALTPVRAMLTTREEHSRLGIQRAFAERVPCIYPGPDCDRIKAVFAQLDYRDFKLPLGWQISDRTRRLIDRQSGIPSKCVPQPYVSQPLINPVERVEFRLRNNDCEACKLRSVMLDRKFDIEQCVSGQ
jgi:hypothetical protein